MFPFRELYSLLVLFGKERLCSRLQRETNLCSMLVFAEVKVSIFLEHIHFLHQRINEKKHTIDDCRDIWWRWRERERGDCINRNVQMFKCLGWLDMINLSCQVGKWYISSFAIPNISVRKWFLFEEVFHLVKRNVYPPKLSVRCFVGRLFFHWEVLLTRIFVDWHRCFWGFVDGLCKGFLTHLPGKPSSQDGNGNPPCKKYRQQIVYPVSTCICCMCVFHFHLRFWLYEAFLEPFQQKWIQECGAQSRRQCLLFCPRAIVRTVLDGIQCSDALKKYQALEFRE